MMEGTAGEYSGEGDRGVLESGNVFYRVIVGVR